ncbi:MAG: ABC transporter permease [Chloroflexota bacterium]
MSRFIIKRLITGTLTLFIVSLIVFLISRMTGNPVDIYLETTATQADRDMLYQAMGLDQPLHVQYFIFLQNAIHGDLGRSHYWGGRPVAELILSRLGNTLQLAAVSFSLSLLLSIPMGVIAAVHRGRWWDWLVRGFVFFGQSLPHFWLGIMLILLFAVALNLLPPGGKGGLETFLMPAVTLGWASAAAITRLVRSSVLEVLSSDFIRTARAKGLSEFVVLRRHALRNALIPTVAYCTVTLVRSFIVGSVVVETVFGWPGMGRLAYEATFARDFPTVQGIVIVIAVAVIVFNLLADLLYGWLDPRIIYE